ncbi:MAG: hypothetical protein M0T72_08435 [Candidatus Dormibacteraeota bacterium]|nr:hypothetical protein [Candidatus Dormibacteraeota bacterium]
MRGVDRSPYPGHEAERHSAAEPRWPHFPPRPHACEHCYCQRTTVGGIEHRVCCQCGNRVAVHNTFGYPVRPGG